MVFKIGCCGFPTSKVKYFKAFNLVELNSTFYTYPKLTLAKKWKEEAPPDFEFTVKAHQDISHNYKLADSLDCLKAFNQMKAICSTLDAKILLIQTPGSFKPTKENIAVAQKFFKKIHRNKLAIAWETRGPDWDQPELRKTLATMLKELDVTHVTDPFKTMPAYVGTFAYFRLHGLGTRMYYYQYSDDELRKLIEKVGPLEKEGKTVYIFFNNLAMFDDGQRLNYFLQKNKFPSITGATGLESVRALIQRTRYPASKSKLSKLFGWKLVEWGKNEQIPLDNLLKNLPTKTYESVEEVLFEIKKSMGIS
ncbi:DUF72 domain-containing protein [Candidatus Bathyarchaeota archaeon]|nr:DUF72 domain-containing protein [Candidatus Bathyarchaeota archaeon]